MMTGTCGHIVSWPPRTVAIKAYFWGHRAITYVVYCQDCIEHSRDAGELLENRDAEQEWLCSQEREHA